MQMETVAATFAKPARLMPYLDWSRRCVECTAGGQRESKYNVIAIAGGFCRLNSRRARCAGRERNLGQHGGHDSCIKEAVIGNIVEFKHPPAEFLDPSLVSQAAGLARVTERHNRGTGTAFGHGLILVEIVHPVKCARTFYATNGDISGV